jgi:putative oxidoreductase
MLGRLKPGRPWAWLAAVSELGGGVLTLLEFLNPLGPLGVIGSITMATTKAHAAKSIGVTEGGAELPVTNIDAATVLTVNGPGKWSLDGAFSIQLPRWLAPLGLGGVILTVIYAGRGGETEPEQDEAHEGAVGNDEA